MSDVDSLVAQLIGSAIDGNEPDSANLVEQLVGRHGVKYVLSTIRRLCVDVERLPQVGPSPARELRTSDGHRFNIGDVVDGVLLSDSFDDVDFVVSSVEPLLATTGLVHAAVERCTELPAILTWSHADLVATDAPHFSSIRRIALRGAESAAELLRLAEYLDAQGEEIAARAFGSAAKARDAIVFDTSRGREETN